MFMKFSQPEGIVLIIKSLDPLIIFEGDCYGG
jgi:hypothetical protein